MEITTAEFKMLMDKLEQIRKETTMRFPEAKYWSWKPVRKEEPIPLGGSLDVYSGIGSGWFYIAVLISNNPFVKICIDAYADGVIEVRDTIYELELRGAAATNLLKVVMYDDFNLLYSVEFTPGILGFMGMPYREKNKFWLENPASVTLEPFLPTVTIANPSAAIISIVGFLLPIKEVL